jgi:galactokinase
LVQDAELRSNFEKLYQARPRFYRAPGRVNLIGEHTDYNDGFVMPVAVDLYTWVAIAPRRDRKLVLYSQNYSDGAEVDLDRISPGPRRHWSDYVRGVAAVLEKAGLRLAGANLLIHGEVPIGSGLGSSAALEVSSGYALLSLAGIPIDRTQLSLACQRAEHEFAGTRCGIMDQFISCHGRSKHALLLDTRSLAFEWLPLPSQVSVIVCNTMVKHSLTTDEYNTRRAECEAGVRALAARLPELRALRDATLSDFEKKAAGLPQKIYRRCRHVISENERVEAVACALKEKNFDALERLMRESHRSLRDDYEVSCRELDVMVELAGQLEGVYGARMTGGGFGGCTVNLVRAEKSAEFQTRIAQEYEKHTGLKPEVYVCTAAEGVQERLSTGESICA